MKLGFGPYAGWAYGEVLIENHGYVEFPTKETRWGNWKKKDTLERWNWLRELGLYPATTGAELH